MRASLYLIGALSLAACNDLVGKTELPSGTRDPSTFNNPAGAIAQGRGAIALFRGRLNQDIVTSGQLTDELTSDLPINLRSGTGGYATDYENLQRTREQAALARTAINRYAPDAPSAVLAELYGVEAYTDMWLADMFCSGVPLSTVDYDGDFTLHAGSTTTEVYRTAIALLDSAISLAGDSLPIKTFVRVGLGRALLSIGQYDSAAHVVASVSDTDTYQTRVHLEMWDNRFSGGGTVSISDREGINGLPFRTAEDPRVPVTVSQSTNFVTGQPYNFYSFGKYDLALTGDSLSVVVASGVEARLIEAEAALEDGNVGGWLSTLNALRTDSTFAVSGTDTIWNAGRGGVAGLAPLTDPGNTTARVTLMFSERAYWLYLTGHRQSDFRRLIRTPALGGYGRQPDAVYPTGRYSLTAIYGEMTSIAIPQSEQGNPLFQGCLNHE